MGAEWESHLERWRASGLIDEAAAARIREWEARLAPSTHLQWPVLIALACGALLLAAGLLLLVSAHWDEIAPGQRMALVLLLTAIFHAGGAAAAERFETLAIALHTVGTAALGAGIALAGQIYHVSEHWPGAILLWSLGAALAWLLLRHWTQAALVSILVPWWLAGEWSVRWHWEAPVAAGICALSLAYLSARQGPDDSSLRRALAWIGGFALLPAAAFAAAESWRFQPAWSVQALGWCVAAALPLGVGWLLRGNRMAWNAAAVAWSMLIFAVNDSRLLVHAWCAAGAVGLAFWGVREARAERINLGFAGFALSVLSFYFSSVMDKLGRSASLIVLGLLFLGGGWLLEYMRRDLVLKIHEGQP